MLVKRELLVLAGFVCLLLLPRAASGQTFLTSWSIPNREVDDVAVSSVGEVYVPVYDGQVQVFSQDGTFLRAWPVPPTATHIVLDANDNVFVTTSTAGTYKYTSTGTALGIA